MFLKIRKRITYTNVVLTLALLFTMTGGAYGAKHYVINSTGQISPKVLKALQGKAGAAGAVGAAGSQGAAGARGATGAVGEKGAAGSPGPQGKEGETGEEGETGAPWPAGGTLPKGASEQGVWSAEGPPSADTFLARIVQASISFNIPLKSAPTPHIIEAGTTPQAGEGCKGSEEAPEAEPGNLCIFVLNKVNTLALASISLQPIGFNVAGTAGAIVGAVPEPEKTEGAFVNGTWAVTGGE